VLGVNHGVSRSSTRTDPRVLPLPPASSGTILCGNESGSMTSQTTRLLASEEQPIETDLDRVVTGPATSRWLDTLSVESIRPTPSASKRTRRAIARVQSAITRGVYRYTGGIGMAPAAYETWFWLGAIVPAGVVLAESCDEAREAREAAQVLRREGDGHLAVAARLDEEADRLEQQRRRRPGPPADPRRGFGGLGGFVITLQGDRDDPGMTLDEIVELVYDAPHDWLPRAPVTDSELIEKGWLHTGARATEARERLRNVLTQAASVEAKRQGLKRPRGGKRRPGR
jgi:hypothetical protein